MQPVSSDTVGLGVSSTSVPPAEPLLEVPPTDSLTDLRRWLPPDSQFVVVFSLEHDSDRSAAAEAAPLAGPLWSKVLSPAFSTFGLHFSAVRRVAWAAEQWNDWPNGGVLFVELAGGHDAHLLQAKGFPADATVAGIACRQLDANSPWPLAFAVLDEHTFVTGALSLLRAAGDRADSAEFTVPAIEHLWKAMPRDGRLLAVANLGTLPARERERLAALLDVWPQAADPWRVLCEAAAGVGVASGRGDDAESLVALRCDSPAVADQLRGAVSQLIPAVQGLLGEQRLPGGQAGENAPPLQGRYESLAGCLQEWLEQSQWEVVDQTVWIRCGKAKSPLIMAAHAVAARAEIHRRWLSLARNADTERHQAIARGLERYHEAEGRFPPGAGGAELLPPETRLSWIAIMLPHLGRDDWHTQLEFGYSWNSPQNRPVTARRLPEVTNPALGPSVSDSGFPVTHYVGVAGVGPDAARLPAGDPRAGVFGFSRSTRLDQIPDGAANTLALLGASSKLGPWAAGGSATVRALTTRPYVNGPDGFGSGLPDGMLATMADGSVRFISKDVDPQVLEQLAAGGDGGRIDPASLAAGQSMVAGTTSGAAAQPPKEPSLDLPGDRRTATSQSAGPPQVGRAELQDESPRQPGQMPQAAEAEKTDVESALALQLTSAKLPGVRLIDAVRLISDLTGAPLSFDLDTLLLLGHTVQEKVELELHDATADQLLAGVLSNCQLAHVIDGHHLIVTVPEPQRVALRNLRYTVNDLVGQDQQSLQQLVAWIVDFVAPETWQQKGGRGAASAEPGTLLIAQTETVHRQVISFCEKLRTARGLPLRSRFDPELFTLQTRYDRARRALAQPLSANFSEPAPLGRILDELEQLSGVTMVVDHRTLANEGLDIAVPATISVQNEPLEAVLDELLLPQGLAWRAMDAATLEITTRNAAAGRLELEFYRVGDLLGEQLDAADLLDRIKAQVGGGTWTDAGGPGVIRFDAPSKCLVVLQSQPVQIELQGLLEAWREDRQQR